MRARGQLLSLASVTLQAAQSIVDEGWLGVPDHNSEQRLMLALNNEIAKLETIRSGLAEQKLPEACARLGALQDTFVLQVRVRGNQGTAGGAATHLCSAGEGQEKPGHSGQAHFLHINVYILHAPVSH